MYLMRLINKVKARHGWGRILKASTLDWVKQPTMTNILTTAEVNLNEIRIT